MDNRPVIIHTDYDRRQDEVKRAGDALDDYYHQVLRYLREKYHSYPAIPNCGHLTPQQETELASYEQLAVICAETGLGQ